MKNFTIPKPCHENWDKMMPEERGRFCSSCSRTVYDFTQKTDVEIQEIFTQKEGNICGKFEEKQLVQFSKFQFVILNLSKVTQNKFSPSGVVFSVMAVLLAITGCTKKINAVSKTDAKVDSSLVNILNVDSTQRFEIGEMAPVHSDSAQIKMNNEKTVAAKKVQLPKPPKVVEIVAPTISPPPKATLGVPVAID